MNRIYIPSYGRANKQITWNNLPEKWKQLETNVKSQRIHAPFSAEPKSP